MLFGSEARKSSSPRSSGNGGDGCGGGGLPALSGRFSSLSALRRLPPASCRLRRRGASAAPPGAGRGAPSAKAELSSAGGGGSPAGIGGAAGGGAASPSLPERTSVSPERIESPSASAPCAVAAAAAARATAVGPAMVGAPVGAAAVKKAMAADGSASAASPAASAGEAVWLRDAGRLPPAGLRACNTSAVAHGPSGSAGSPAPGSAPELRQGPPSGAGSTAATFCPAASGEQASSSLGAAAPAPSGEHAPSLKGSNSIHSTVSAGTQSSVPRGKAWGSTGERHGANVRQGHGAVVGKRHGARGWGAGEGAWGDRERASARRGVHLSGVTRGKWVGERGTLAQALPAGRTSGVVRGGAVETGTLAEPLPLPWRCSPLAQLFRFQGPDGLALEVNEEPLAAGGGRS
eukprot:scaffold10224_cov53-Isochrysis_galbana.AAC.1